MEVRLIDVERAARRRLWLQRGAVVAIWLVALLAWSRYQSSNELSAAGAAQEFIDRVEEAWWGVLAFLGVYLARPIVLFPATVLTVVGGVLFGPVAGVVIVVVAANSSAMIAYLIGRILGRAPGLSGNSLADDAAAPAATDEGHSILGRWSSRLRNNSFETVLVMRFLFLPYDLVSYVAGALRIRWAPFLAATALGSLPGTVSFVLLGASLGRVDQGLDGIEPLYIALGLILFVASLVIARVVKRRQTDAGAIESDPSTSASTSPPANQPASPPSRQNRASR